MAEPTFVSEDVLDQAEFAAWCEEHPDLARGAELIEGRIVMPPPASWEHGGHEIEAGARLRNWVREKGLGRVFGPSTGYELPTGDTLGPDASFISNERWAAGPAPSPGKFLHLVPDLVVEILSPSTQRRDRTEKRRIYAASGVREYWILDAVRREVTVFRTAGEGRFDGGRTLGPDDVLESSVLSGFSIRAGDLFQL